MIEVSRLKDVKTAELFLGFRMGGRRSSRLCRLSSTGSPRFPEAEELLLHQMSVGSEMVIVLKALVEYGVSLVLGHPFEYPRLEVSQTDVFHCSSPLGGGQHYNLAFVLCLASFRSVGPPLYANRESSQMLLGVAHSEDGRTRQTRSPRFFFL